MIKSMTGFAAVTRDDDLATLAVTIRAVNHRYLDLQLRIPQSLAGIESDVRAMAARQTGRPQTLEDVFMTYTGRSLDDDVEEDEADDED